MEVVAVEADEETKNFAEDFDAFARRLHPRLVSSVELYCGDLTVAEDAAQDALVKALLHWERLRSSGSPDAYVMRIAMNAATAWYRRLRTARRAADRQRSSEVAPATDLAGALALRASLALLPARQRQAVVLRYFGGFSVAETAAAMACAEGTARALTAQAIAGLRRNLDFDVREDPYAE